MYRLAIAITATILASQSYLASEVLEDLETRKSVDEQIESNKIEANKLEDARVSQQVQAKKLENERVERKIQERKDLERKLDAERRQRQLNR